MGKGPLAVRFHAVRLDPPQAGRLGAARLELENSGSVSWREPVRLAYHWLDERGNPIVWDGVRTPLPLTAPGERISVEARVRGAMPPGRYLLAFDLVAEHRAWFAELGGAPHKLEVEVEPRRGGGRLDLPPGVALEPGSAARIAAAHAEGYAVVAGAVAWPGRRAPAELAPYRPGGGRVPNFPHPLLCPSVAEGVELERLGEVAGLPAYAAPAEEPWLYDGRIVLVPAGA